MPTSQTGPSSGAPTLSRPRLLAPDLARGMMLLLIALAHSRMLHAGGNDYSAPAAGSALDTAVQWLLTSAVDGRAAPLFGMLFGYGLVQMVRRFSGPGGDGRARQLVRRRGAWLVVFGIAHIVLLYSGDVIAAYGMFALLFAGAVFWPDRRLWWVAAVSLVLGALAVGAVQLGAQSAVGLPVGATLLDSALIRASGIPVLPVAALLMAAPVLLGVLLGRWRILEEPERYAALLRRTVLLGFAIAVLGAQPVALQAVGVWSPATTAGGLAASAVFSVTGMAGGLAYAAAITLVAARLREPYGPVTTALAACGQRSMTFYIAQSPVWFVLIEPSLLGLGGQLSAAAAAGIAALTWAATVAVAAVLHRAGLRGPFEALLRRLVYGNRRP
ncbi:DUF418 domain-containing protein [Nocardiopsis coralliicola]